MATVSQFEKEVNELCEGLGEAEVRKRLRQGHFVGKRKNYVEGWLERIEAERSLAAHETNSSNANMQIELARAAADAARDAADAARDQADAAQQANDIAQKANIIATVALIAAVIAIAISIISLFVS